MLKSSVFLLPLLGVAVACGAFVDWWIAVPKGAQATYVGGQACAACHATQYAGWVGSHHDRAMDLATEESVLGDFNGATLEHYGVTSTMFRRDGKFYIHTEGPDGELADFEIKYVFGVEPLQQYMVELKRGADAADNEVGQVQVLRVSWDTEKKRWFYLSPPDVDEKLAPDDQMHWTGVAQNWNHMCASCHSTGYQKNYDLATKTYHSTFQEIDVSCETCHGPGSLHVELANATSFFWDRNVGYGLRQVDSKESTPQIESCAPCHSRRRTVHPDDPPGQGYYDCYVNELLMPETYYCDGQILDEVYVYGSFLQSKMYHNGIRCTDCHDPHSNRLKLEGNQLCVSCHDAHPAGKYDTPNHHHHMPGTPGAECANCHMPETPYMEVDFRRDHSLRIPRPDLSVDLDTPNACTGCHLERGNVDADKHALLPHYAAWMQAAKAGDEQVAAEIKRVDRWAAEQCDQWYPGKYGKQDHFAYTLSRAWQRDVSCVDDLYELARLPRHAAIVRASALVQLAQLAPRRALELSQRLLDDKDPQLRTTATMVMEGAPLRTRLEKVTPLLQDPLRSVRTEAARVLADVSPTALPREDRPRQDAALAEYRRGLEDNADLAMAHLGLGILSERQKNFEAAVQHYRDAIDVQPDVTGPRSNLAEMYASIAERVPGTPRAERAHAEIARLRAEELKLFARDVRLLPNSGVTHYRYGLALYLSGDLEGARTHLARAVELEPDEMTFRQALSELLKVLPKQ